ncbi:MAG: hypothetical protein ACLP6E_06395 [Acidimicrobiales bacterium]
MIEIMRFKLAASAREDDFLRADRAVQEDFGYHQPGLMRRTTARDSEGNWIVIDLWRSESDADECAARWDDDPVAQGFMNLLDPTSTSVERYAQLE